MKQEDYLETLYNLEKKLSSIRITDLAKALNLSKPSVTQMMQRLNKDSCVKYEAYTPIKLTAKGRKIGKKIAERHEVLADFFTILNIPKRIQEKDIHGIEHHLSPITVDKLKILSKFLKDKNF
jgi:Mn-dependent DtxR family transcriptional regulator